MMTSGAPVKSQNTKIEDYVHHHRTQAFVELYSKFAFFSPDYGSNLTQGVRPLAQLPVTVAVSSRSKRTMRHL